MLGRLTARRRGESGAAAVEFALIALFVLLPLMVAIIQFSIYFWAYQAGANGAREGARRYAVDPCGTGQAALVVSRIGGAAANTPTVNAAFAKDSGNTGAKKEAGDKVTVTVTFTAHEIAAGFVPMPGSGTVKQTSTARIEDVEDCP